MTIKSKIINTIYKTEPQTASFYRAQISGKFISVSRYSKPIMLNKRPPKIKDKVPKRLDFDKYIYLREKYQKRKKNRAINNIQTIIESNFNSNSVFLTLTFKENVRELSEAMYYWNLFFTKMRKLYPKLKYVAVPEYQDENDRGVLHFHVLLNYRYLDKAIVDHFWPYGFTFITRVYSTTGLSAYLVKYMVKGFKDYRFYGQRTFFCSKGLKRAKIIYFDKAEKLFNYCRQNYEPIFVRVIDSEYNGDIFKFKYQLKSEPNVDKLLQKIYKD